MALKLTHYYRLQRDVVDHAAVIGHLHLVLNKFLRTGDCSRFYIGITGDLENRRRQHERERPEFTLMCSIYSEPGSIIADDFHALEARALSTFQRGVFNPATGKRLLCTNVAAGSRPKRWLYLLVDKRDCSGIPFRRPGDLWAGEG